MMRRPNTILNSSPELATPTVAASIPMNLAAVLMSLEMVLKCICITESGTCLAVQWLRLCASTAGGTGSTPGWGTKILTCHKVCLPLPAPHHKKIRERPQKSPLPFCHVRTPRADNRKWPLTSDSVGTLIFDFPAS